MPDTPTRNLPPKKEVALALLEGDSVFIHLDPRQAGVAVPKHLSKQAQLVLQIGLNLAIRIPDLSIEEEGISCTLHFHRVPFRCHLPWGAIYALVGPDGRGMLWPEDVPPEVAEQMRSGRKPSRAAKKPRTKLASVAREEPARPAAATAGDPEAPAPQAPEPKKRAVARPTLAAVPAPSRPGAPPPSARGFDPRAPLGAHQRPSDPGRATPSRPSPSRPFSTADQRREPVRSDPHAASGSPGRPKRELPPYLRVVK